MYNKLIIAIIALALVSCQAPNKEAEKANNESKSAENAKTVKVSKIKKETINIIEEYTATLDAYDKVFLAPTIPGRIKNICVEVNDKVTKGQKVVDMDDTQLVQLEIQFNTLAKELQRMDTLKAYGSVSDQAYDQIKSQYDATKASLQNMKENIVLTSPLSGVITGRYYENNEIYSGAPNTQQGKAAIVTVEQINKLKAVVNVSARYFPSVKNGLKATLHTDIYPGKSFEGTVSLVYPTIDPATRTFTVEVTIPNNNLTLRPGMYSEIEFSLGQKQAIVAPASAVMMLQGTSERYVYIAKNNKAKLVKVELGERFNDKLEILSDEINEGDLLIVSGQTKLESEDELEIVK